MTANRTSGDWARSAAAALVLAVIVVGVPVALWLTVGWPLPQGLPTVGVVTNALMNPLAAEVVVKALAVGAWLGWAHFVICVAVEGWAELSGRSIAPRVPLGGLNQQAARRLVVTLLMTTAITAGGLTPAAALTDPAPFAASATVAAAPNAGAPAGALNVAVPLPSGTISRDVVAPTMTGDEAGLRRYVVAAPQQGYADNLWDIAERHLGDGMRWREVFALNQGAEQPDGRMLRDEDMIHPGWQLRMPAEATDLPAWDAAPPAPESFSTPAPSSVAPPVPGEKARPGDTAAAPESAEAPTSPVEARGPITWVPTQPAAPPAATSAPSVPVEARGPNTWVPTRPGTPPAATSAPPAPQRSEAPASPAARETRPVDALGTPMWTLVGLTGGGAVLAASMFLLLGRRRRAQFRARRPGRSIAFPAARLGPVERSVTVSGSAVAPTVELMDALLRRLAARRVTEAQAMPDLVAVELTETAVIVHLSAACELPAPWTGSEDRRQWACRSDVDVDDVGPLVVDQPAPFPLLVTVGASDTGEVWLLNCEALGAICITGDQAHGAAFARYVAAELAVNPWSREVSVDCVGIAEEVASMNPSQVRFHPVDGDDVTAEVLTEAVAMVDRATDVGRDATTARVAQLGDDTWPTRLLLLASAAPEPPALVELLRLVEDHRDRAGTSVVVNGARDDTAGVVLEVTSGGRVRMPQVGLDLVAVGLSSEEATGCAALLAQSEDLVDVAMPQGGAEEGWRGYADVAGALREEHTVARGSPVEDLLEPAESVLGGPDEDYERSAATTAEDLEVLAPRVPVRVRAELEEADPCLDEDLAAWFSADCDLPRLTLLGPVSARTRGSAVVVAHRKAFYTELLAYLALRPSGATPAQVADAFDLSVGRVRTDVKVVRDWLGTNPRTGEKHLPDANRSAAGRARGVGVYQVDGVLVDADLFRRLRVRGETRAEDGIADLRRALSLVTGRPFDQLRTAGWSWLQEGDRLDQHMVCAVVDVAHLVTTAGLRAGDLTRARAAAELAALAAPHEEIPRLDLAAVYAAEGHPQEAERILREDVCNRSDDGLAPMELSQRTERILRAHDWLKAGKAAS